ncbi:MAG: peptidoglycan DD-metalloendopeptidase family protein [Hyphomonas sp.]|uniref:M23 family metallopeptidase n=1 Tax=Hyphomonas sp. TaxID=87 RepID=UPI00184937A4|nr:M23 family metallopeptidase [Hyphomonas sp.]MBA3068208.1 peptidoglycan DD-metalloendopeptidase family protein [Hyphomonas sp.]MBU3921412.1 M23 family metallopeptidase [Alphaproteobacteria bacterium]MBU4060926.1 M23 family metallopeptidase [Alphaproteobacteria bacterium]MBU4164910.1 M23 family metallopeptidase [Alphaproteobacteria bacterium]
MKRRKPQTPATVKRIEAPHRWFERMAAFAVIGVMTGLFLVVRADQPPPIPDVGFGATDFRMAAPEAATSARTGRITANVATADALEVLGASPDDAAGAADALRGAAPTRGARLRPGSPFVAYFDESGEEGAPLLTGVSVRINPKTTLSATRREDGTFFASVLSAKTTTALHRISGVIDTNLADAIDAGGGTRAQADTFASLFPEDPELARGGRPGERFDVVIEMIADERGNFLEAGDLVFAAFNGRKSAGSWYRFTPDDSGLPEFFNRNGVAGDEFLNRDPLRGGEISSGFGNRIHPITGDVVLHAGVDFRAPTGTPIRAAGSGLITDMRYGEGYGWFVRIQHERGFETVYAHMSAFAEGLTPGRTVMRGDTIGYVGSTGSSTGAHLHFEVLRNGAYVNPLTLALPTGRDLSGDKALFAAFEAQRGTIDTFRNETLGGQLYAATNSTDRIANATAP